MFFIDALEIDDQILEKIESKHDIRFEEVEEACYREEVHVRRGRDGLYKLFSRTNSGRYILVVLVHRGGRTWKIVTARDMTDSERILYRKATGRR